MNIPFLTKEEYLELRREWKKEYLRLSGLIRAEKQAVRLMSRGGYSAARALQSQLAHDRVDARDMMDDLEDVKQAGRMSRSFQNYMTTTNLG